MPDRTIVIDTGALGQLLNSHLGGTLDVFGCPSHAPYVPAYVRANRNGSAGAFGAGVAARGT